MANGILGDIVAAKRTELAARFDGRSLDAMRARAVPTARSLEQAIAKIRQLPEAEQDEAAEVLFSVIAKRSEPVRLDEETRAAIREGSEQARRGEFVSDEEMAAFFKAHGS